MTFEEGTVWGAAIVAAFEAIRRREEDRVKEVYFATMRELQARRRAKTEGG